MSHEQDPEQQLFAESLERVSLDSLRLSADSREVLMYQCGLAAAESERTKPTWVDGDFPSNSNRSKSPWLFRLMSAAMVLVAFGFGNFLGRTADSVQHVQGPAPAADLQNAESETRRAGPDATDEHLSELFQLASGSTKRSSRAILAMTDWNNVETFLTGESKLESSSNSADFIDDARPMSVWMSECRQAELFLF